VKKKGEHCRSGAKLHAAAGSKFNAQESVGLRKSKRKFGWSRTGFVDFAGQ
jgi:hypothetical protein